MQFDFFRAHFDKLVECVATSWQYFDFQTLQLLLLLLIMANIRRIKSVPAVENNHHGKRYVRKLRAKNSQQMIHLPRTEVTLLQRAWCA